MFEKLEEKIDNFMGKYINHITTGTIIACVGLSFIPIIYPINTIKWINGSQYLVISSKAEEKKSNPIKFRVPSMDFDKDGKITEKEIEKYNSIPYIFEIIGYDRDEDGKIDLINVVRSKKPGDWYRHKISYESQDKEFASLLAKLSK